MLSATYIFNSGFAGLVADNPNRHPKREKSLDYSIILESESHSGDATYDALLRNLAMTLRTIYGMDPYQKGVSKSFEDKIDALMREHTGMNYQEFSIASNPEEFQSDDFRIISKPSLKRRLFEYRSRLYLSAIVGCLEEGYDLGAVLEVLKSRRIPYIKKEDQEPTCQRILDVFRNR